MMRFHQADPSLTAELARAGRGHDRRPPDAVSRGLGDTSVFIARESGRMLDEAAQPDGVAVSIITIGERWRPRGRNR